MKTWLVIDVHYLCHRAFHVMGGLSHDGSATGVIFSFLRSIRDLKDEFQTDRVAFCFESKHLFRREAYPDYKRTRVERRKTKEQKAASESLAIQISELKKRYLPKIGFKNIFCYRGYESDDIMAEIARSSDDEIILVTADKDMFQCLSSNVMIYSPQKKKLLTWQWFKKEYGIEPVQWAMVKSVAGCSSDEIQGVQGVGEVTALKYIRGELKSNNKAFQRINCPRGRAIVDRNFPLVKLPYFKCPTPLLIEDRLDLREWKSVCKLLGMKSIINHPPIAMGKKHQHESEERE